MIPSPVVAAGAELRARRRELKLAVKWARDPWEIARYRERLRLAVRKFQGVCLQAGVSKCT